MKALKSIITAAVFIAIFSAQAIANPIIPKDYNVNTPLADVRAEVNKVMQNTAFADLGIDYAEVLLKFKFNQRGQLVIMEMNSESTEMLNLVQDKLSNYRIGDTPVPVDMIYHVKLKFELK